MRFRSYDALRIFDVVASAGSFTEAARQLNLTKGAISYQIRQLEGELGFDVFVREHRRIALTARGKALWHFSQSAFRDFEQQIAQLRDADPARITIGTTTYFASRWLSSRLMGLMVAHPGIALRLQPIVDQHQTGDGDVDIIVRWGRGGWSDLEIEPLLACPAFATTGSAFAETVRRDGFASAMARATLLHDRDGSSAWSEWHRAAGLPHRHAEAGLVIPDPNVRVQAVIDGQGLALNDALVEVELNAGTLYRIGDVELPDYGYFLAYRKGALGNVALKAFRDWIVAEAA